MKIDLPQALLGGLSPKQFMRRHWQKKPLLVRAAVDAAVAPWSRAEVFGLAAQEGVESRLVECDDAAGRARWRLRHGPLPRRALPPLSRPGWTLLVQGFDLHLDAAHELLSRFDFVPGVRLDDLMVSYASPGGGVGPHVDSYDVFLLQLQGRRRWRVGDGPCAEPLPLRDDVPLKMLSHFEPAQEWLLEPGDMLYLPPGWAHDGIADSGDCMTASIGFRSPRADELVQAVLSRLADSLDASSGDPQSGKARAARSAARYADAKQRATATPAAMPEALQRFASRAIRRALGDPRALDRALGEWLTEPKPQVWFDADRQPDAAMLLLAGVRLDRRTRMAYDKGHIFINGESLRASGADARLMRLLADQRRLDAPSVARASAASRDMLGEWRAQGWLHDDD